MFLLVRADATLEHAEHVLDHLVVLRDGVGIVAHGSHVLIENSDEDVEEEVEHEKEVEQQHDGAQAAERLVDSWQSGKSRRIDLKFDLVIYNISILTSVISNIIKFKRFTSLMCYLNKKYNKIVQGQCNQSEL